MVKKVKEKYMVELAEYNRLQAWAYINIDKPNNAEAANIILKVLDAAQIKINPQSRPRTDPYIVLYSWAWAYRYGEAGAAKEFCEYQTTISKRIKALAESLGMNKDDIMEQDVDSMLPKAKEFIERHLKDDFVFDLYRGYKKLKDKGVKIL